MTGIVRMAEGTLGRRHGFQIQTIVPAGSSPVEDRRGYGLGDGPIYWRAMTRLSKSTMLTGFLVQRSVM